MATTTDDALARAEALAPLLRALAEPRRLALVLLLAEEARTVKELQEATGLGQTLVSHHLKTLRDQGLVRMEPRGRSNVYELCCDALADPVRVIGALAAG
jgi:DNA-binding transcriptional ArsR family regulator